MKSQPTGSIFIAVRPSLPLKVLVTGGLMVVGEQRKLLTDLVISASGVTPCSELAVEAGLKTGIAGAVAVDAMMRTSDDRIYAAGDCADAIHVVTGDKCWIPLALRANRAGWAVADNVCGKEIRLQGVVGTAVFKVFNMQVARTGLCLQEAREAGFDPAEVVIKSRSKAHSRSRFGHDPCIHGGG